MVLFLFSCQKEGPVKWSRPTGVVTRTALKSGHKQWNVPVYLGKWLGQQETDLPVWMVSNGFLALSHGCSFMRSLRIIVCKLTVVLDHARGMSKVLCSQMLELSIDMNSGSSGIGFECLLQDPCWKQTAIVAVVERWGIWEVPELWGLHHYTWS